MTNTPPENPKLFSIPAYHRHRTSDVFLSLAEQCKGEKITLYALTERLGDRTFGILLILFAAFNVIPFVSLFSGLFASLLGFQMVLGKRQPWLPLAMLNMQLPSSHVRNALLVFAPKIKAIEKYIRPRWQFSEAPIVDRINGLVIVILGLIIALPIPLTNIGPALVIVVMGLGLVERDGLVQVLAILFGITSVTLIYFLVLATAGTLSG